jgi:hypothetical protein
MGYDYFLSDALKKGINESAFDYVKAQQVIVDQALRNQREQLRSARPILLSGAIFALLFWGSLSTMKVVGHLGGGVWGVIVFALLTLFFLYGATRGLIEGLTGGILPFTLPVIMRAVTSFLLFSSKGVIAAFGLLFLLASFACRYYNLLHH